MSEVNDNDLKYTDSDIDEVIKHWKSELKKYILYDYADMIGAPASYRGQKFCYGDPEPYFIEDTISMLEDLKKSHRTIIENKSDLLCLLEKIESRLEFDVRFKHSPLHKKAVSNFILNEDETRLLVNVIKENLER